MGTILYYFTGTGNSLAVGRALSSFLGECTLVPVVREAERPGTIAPDAERVGLVCPVYYFGLPTAVAEFTRRLDLSHVRYVFSVLTMGSMGAPAAHRQLDRILLVGPGKRGLDAAFSVRMPGNNILFYDPPGNEAIGRILREADEAVARIAGMVSAEQKVPVPFSPLASLVHLVVYPGFSRRVHGGDRRFAADERCTACGTCAAVCPVGNIRIENDRPVWLHRCEMCMACIQFCPASAIQARGTEKRRRYHHPLVTERDLAEQRRG